ncbi:RBP11-like subunits of RNA polymerase [Gymnopus androsaceus JB14]|uniref:RBP11-like subunits of RNA polymerase n=1 Tax=Gymnopus androsaceus JB14 TaxID=1447944 RepID=A0A6A4I512_9AGAR|nr:RBP11-like subunits of RNA polymerase [Gymnopus androsaceus JB14]
MNAPDRFTLFVLDEGEAPVEVNEDTKIPNAATIKILKQDHTLGNMLRAQLLSMPQVLFAGYKVPHPLHPYFLLKIQTDGSIAPDLLLSEACNQLIGTLASLEGKFKREFAFKEADGAGLGATGVGGAGHGGAAFATSDDPYGTGAGTGGTASWGNRDDYLDF